MQLATCHPNRKHKAKGFCGPCYEKHLKAKSPEYAQRQSESSRRWLDNLSPERLAELQGYRSRKWHSQKDDPEQKRKRRTALLLRKYGITANEYDSLLLSQGGGCAICRRKPGDKPHHVDHCHATGRVRGILCPQCNWYAGTVDADPEIISRLRDYLA